MRKDVFFRKLNVLCRKTCLLNNAFNKNSPSEGKKLWFIKRS